MGRMDFKQDDKYDPKLQSNLHTLVIGPAYREWVKSSNDAGMRAVHLPDGPFANAAEEDQWLAEYDPKMGAIAINVAANLQPRLKRRWAKKDKGAGAYMMAKEAQLPHLSAKYTKYGKERDRSRARGSGRRGGRGSARGRARGDP
jgi:outer membrane protein TolC